MKISCCIEIGDAGPSAGRRIISLCSVESDKATNVITSVPTSHNQDLAIRQQRRGVVAAADEVTRVIPRPGCQIVNFGARVYGRVAKASGTGKTVTRGYQQIPIWQYRRRVTVAARVEVARDAPRSSTWIINFGRLKNGRSIPASRNQHPAVTQQRRGMPGTSPVEITGLAPCSCRRVVQLRCVSGRRPHSKALEPSGDQHLPIPEERRREQVTRYVEAAGNTPCPGRWIVQLRAVSDV